MSLCLKLLIELSSAWPSGSHPTGSCFPRTCAWMLLISQSKEAAGIGAYGLTLTCHCDEVSYLSDMGKVPRNGLFNPKSSWFARLSHSFVWRSMTPVP